MRRVRLMLLPLALACGPAFAEVPEAKPKGEAEVIALPLPWTAGQVLRYDTEQSESKQRAQVRERTRTSSTTEVTTVAAGKDGFVQHWRGYGTRVEVLEGASALSAALEQASTQLEDLALVVDMDAQGTYRALSNRDEVVRRMREVLRPVLASAFASEVEKAAAALDAQTRKARVDGIPAQVELLLGRLTEPRLLEQMLTSEIQTVLNFSGAQLEDNQSYELETELENPTGGLPFPAKLTFGLYVDANQADDVWLEWTLAIDPEKGAAAVWETVERMYGATFSAEEKTLLPRQVSIVDKGFLLFHRPSGLPEMFENERITRVADVESSKRHRMRLVDNPHGHVWKEAEPAAADAASP